MRDFKIKCISYGTEQRYRDSNSDYLPSNCTGVRPGEEFCAILNRTPIKLVTCVATGHPVTTKTGRAPARFHRRQSVFPLA